MRVYLAKVGEYYESSFWEGVFFDKKKAYREAWCVRNSYIQDNGRNGNKFDILGIWVDVKLMEVK